MAERTFGNEAELVKLGACEQIHGEAILAITKALLQADVGCVGSYEGAPISHRQDMLADLAVRFTTSEAAAAAIVVGIGDVSDPLRRHIQVDGWHKRRDFCVGESGIQRRHGRRTDHPRRGPRRLVKGDPDTHARGQSKFDPVLAAARRLHGGATARRALAVVGDGCAREGAAADG